MSLRWISKIGIFLSACFLYADCGLPNISTRERPCEGGVVFFADFLAWYPSQEVASMWADVITFGTNTASWGVPGFDFQWDYGFRVGAGYDLVYDAWDTQLSWTWFRTSSVHELQTTNPLKLLRPEFDAGFLSGVAPQKMRGSWTLLFNIFDWELGRDYWVSSALSMRPFLGLKGGWIHQDIQVHYEGATISTAREQLKNNFWGVGPLGGVNTKWKLGPWCRAFFSFFGDFSMATLWGNWSNSDFYTSATGQTSAIQTANSSLGALMFRGFAGIGWDCPHFDAKLGYEMQLWSDQLRIATFQLQRLHHDLTLQGLTFNCRLDF